MYMLVRENFAVGNLYGLQCVRMNAYKENLEATNSQLSDDFYARLL